MGEMKSAFERAMERADKLGPASEEDNKRWKYLPEGERLAGKYLADECDLVVEVGGYDDKVRQYVVEGAQAILIRHIDLPRSAEAKRMGKKAMEAFKDLKQDKVNLENVYTKLRRIFNHYEGEGAEQRKQAQEAVKRDIEAKMQQAVQQQPALASSPNFEMEVQQQFQQEWRRVLAQLESQYIKILDECKQEILSLT